MDSPTWISSTGCRPRVSLTRSPPSRTASTVVTITEVYDYLRLLYAMIGNRAARSAPPIAIKMRSRS